MLTKINLKSEKILNNIIYWQLCLMNKLFKKKIFLVNKKFWMLKKIIICWKKKINHQILLN